MILYPYNPDEATFELIYYYNKTLRSINNIGTKLKMVLFSNTLPIF